MARTELLLLPTAFFFFLSGASSPRCCAKEYDASFPIYRRIADIPARHKITNISAMAEHWRAPRAGGLRELSQCARFRLLIFVTKRGSTAQRRYRSRHIRKYQRSPCPIMQSSYRTIEAAKPRHYTFTI